MMDRWFDVRIKKSLFYRCVYESIPDVNGNIDPQRYTKLRSNSPYSFSRREVKRRYINFLTRTRGERNRGKDNLLHLEKLIFDFRQNSDHIVTLSFLDVKTVWNT